MNDEELSKIKEKFSDEVSKNKELRAIAKRISAGKADFSDTARYNDIASDILGSVFSEYVPELDSQGLKEHICTELLRNQYADINDILAQVQTSLDEKKGIKIAPQKAAFPLDRVKKIAHSLEDTTVPTETIQRRAGASCANVSKSFHDDYMKKNASFRNDAGLKCYIVRETDGNCCKWCSALAGRYEYDVFEMPDDIFCRHDNCGCTVTLEHGRTRQNVWSKRSWEAPEINSESYEPTVISPEKAEKLQEQNLPKTLTNGGNNDIIESKIISGALNPDSQRAQEHADRYYESVRHMKTDAKRISVNTDFSEDDINQIKNHVFMQKHDLGNSEPEYFYPSYEMAESWQRLIDGKDIQPHDITMLNHEKMEHELMKMGYSQYEAHKITEKKFNYGLEVKKYYAEINKYKKD
ncbi:MAG: hypothetical protein NC485_13240 [Ruminococcus flavefaciens]|nr:hypothetical protein [Ruminococcus flavefaciens]MCM1060582.1 hypothetical protein [Eubacterium sp.]